MPDTPAVRQPIDPEYGRKLDPAFVEEYNKTFLYWPTVSSIPISYHRSMVDKPKHPGTGDAKEVGKIEEKTVEGVKVRIYRPFVKEGKEDEKLPILFHIHGGGFVLGHPEDGEQASICADYCLAANVIVISVDYCLAPEHKWPAGLDDCWKVFQKVASDPSVTGGDVSRIAIGGESAGGNLSAIVAMLARDAGLTNLRLQLLTIPAVDCVWRTDDPEAPYQSFKENGVGGSVLTHEVMNWFLDNFLPPGVDLKNWKLSPLYAPDFSNLPPAIVSVGELDALRDPALEYAKKLEAAGVSTTVRIYPRVPHIFPYMDAALETARQFRADTAADLRKALWGGEGETSTKPARL